MAKAKAKDQRKQPERSTLDERNRRRRVVLGEMEKMSAKELFQIARPGIYTKDGELTPPYRDDAGPSACRPTD